MSDKLKEIQIKCKGSMTLELEQLEPFQGSLKDLSKENYNKLRKQIIDLGFSEPICVWKNEGKYNILNGHQRVRVLQEMKRSEGFKVPRLPVVEVEAASEHEAKKKVLSLTSQFGEISSDSLFEFASLNNIDLPTLEDFRFPEIDMDEFKSEFFDGEEKPSEDPVDPDVEFAKEIDEENDFIVFVFKDKNDFKQACEKYGVSRVQFNLSSNGSESFHTFGVGRVLDGEKLL